MTVVRIILLVTTIGLSNLAQATTYFVSNSGSDSNKGTTMQTPWQTLAKVNATIFMAGDQILFKKGDVFYGSITIKQSGIPSNPIVFGAYGTGANPVISGFKSVTKWSNVAGNIWESDSVSTLPTCNMVTVDGLNTPMGKYPNNNVNDGYLTINSNTGTSITCNALTGIPNWTGATVVIRANSWTLTQRVVTGQSGATLNFEKELKATVNFGFFIQNDSRTLDQQNEWYYNPHTKKLRLYSKTRPTHVNISTVDNLFIFDNFVKNVIIDGIDFTGANNTAIWRWPYGLAKQKVRNVSIRNCKITYSGGDAIAVCAYGLTIENNTILETNGSAIVTSGGKSAIIQNNYIRNTSLNPGMGASFSAIQMGGVPPSKSFVVGNTIINSGHNGITYGLDTTYIRSNYIDTFNVVLDDGGGIYGGSNGFIAKNTVVNGIGAPKGANYKPGLVVGIYLDDHSANCIVDSNSVANCAWIGLYLHNANSNVIRYNILYNNGTQLRLCDDKPAGSVFGNVFQHNQFVAKVPTQTVCDFTSTKDNLLRFGTFDFNSYTKPNPQDKIINTYQPSTKSVSRSLEDWQSFSKQDSNSRKSPHAIINENDFKPRYIIPKKEI